MSWQRGDFVTLKYRDQSIRAMVASGNGRSLMLGFDGTLGRHAGAMPVLKGDDGVFRSIIDDVAVEITGEDSPDYRLAEIVKRLPLPSGKRPT